jgi:hypothetical protein
VPCKYGCMRPGLVGVGASAPPAARAAAMAAAPARRAGAFSLPPGARGAFAFPLERVTQESSLSLETFSVRPRLEVSLHMRICTNGPQRSSAPRMPAQGASGRDHCARSLRRL